jgi:hypothetical protein
VHREPCTLHHPPPELSFAISAPSFPLLIPIPRPHETICLAPDPRRHRLCRLEILPRAASASAAADEKDEISRRYPLPEFKPIEVLVGGWKAIPASAFPRPVTLNRSAALPVAGGAGTATFDAGAKVVALSATPDGSLIIAPKPDAVMRGPVPIDATDFKAVLGGVYEEFKTRKRAEVSKLRDQARAEAKKIASTPPSSLNHANSDPPSSTIATIGPRPAQNADMTVPAMLANMVERAKARPNAEPPADGVRGWGYVTYREIDGQPYWGASVRYTAKTIFGEFPTEAVALMRQGKVVRWIYAGTGEPLP